MIPPPPPPRQALDLLRTVDAIVVSVSGGKDSQAMVELVCSLVDDKSRIVLVNADLGKAEWEVREHLEGLAARHGVELVVVKPIRTLLESIRRRGKWPDMARRYCTSDHKRAPIEKFIRNRFPSGVVLHCSGERADESMARRKRLGRMGEVTVHSRLTIRRRTVWQWYPMAKWTLEHVWDRINVSGYPAHWVYAEGLRRLSCAFCVFGSKSDLLNAKRLRPELYSELVEMEAEMDARSVSETGKHHFFRQGFPLATLDNNTDDGRTGPCA